jgi:hypothetical protein
VRRTVQQTLLLEAMAPSRLRAGKKTCSRSVATAKRSQHALFEALLYGLWGVVELGDMMILARPRFLR